jgi:hypothetical protein
MTEILHDEEGNPYSVSSARRFADVSPHDTNTIDEFKALYIGGDGNVVVVNSEGDEVTFIGLTAGSILPVYGIQVKDTDTTATNIVALRD